MLCAIVAMAAFFERLDVLPIIFERKISHLLAVSFYVGLTNLLYG